MRTALREPRWGSLEPQRRSIWEGRFPYPEPDRVLGPHARSTPIPPGPVRCPAQSYLGRTSPGRSTAGKPRPSSSSARFGQGERLGLVVGPASGGKNGPSKGGRPTLHLTVNSPHEPNSPLGPIRVGPRTSRAFGDSGSTPSCRAERYGLARTPMTARDSARRAFPRRGSPGRGEAGTPARSLCSNSTRGGRPSERRGLRGIPAERT